MVRQHGPAPEYEASKNTPHAAKAPRSHSNTAVPPQLTSELLHCLSTLPDPWPWVFHTGYTMRNHTHDAVPPAPTVLAPAMPCAPAIPANIVGQMTGAPIAEQPECSFAHFQASVQRSAFEVRKVGLQEFASHLNLTASVVVASACIFVV